VLEGWFGRLDQSAFESVKKAKGSCTGGLVRLIGQSAFESVKKPKEAAPEGWFG